MREQKTQPSTTSVEEFIEKILDKNVRQDCRRLIEIMQEATNEVPVLWTGNIVGFGVYHYKYSSGHEGKAALVAFSPRKSNISIYLMLSYLEDFKCLEMLGKYKAAKGCLYIKRLSDVDEDVLKRLIRTSAQTLRDRYK